MMKNTDPYLYILLRNDLPSLTPGKAVAQGAHAANQFVAFMRKLKADAPESVPPLIEAFAEWEKSANGFGVTVVLGANRLQINRVVTLVEHDNTTLSPAAFRVCADKTFDPSYPYLVDREIAELIDHSEEEYGPVPVGDKMMCVRHEMTAAYVFGRKDDVRSFVMDLELY